MDAVVREIWPIGKPTLDELGLRRGEVVADNAAMLAVVAYSGGEGAIVSELNSIGASLVLLVTVGANVEDARAKMHVLGTLAQFDSVDIFSVEGVSWAEGDQGIILLTAVACGQNLVANTANPFSAFEPAVGGALGSVIFKD